MTHNEYLMFLEIMDLSKLIVVCVSFVIISVSIIRSF